MYIYFTTLLVFSLPQADEGAPVLCPVAGRIVQVGVHTWTPGMCRQPGLRYATHIQPYRKWIRYSTSPGEDNTDMIYNNIAVVFL